MFNRGKKVLSLPLCEALEGRSLLSTVTLGPLPPRQFTGTVFQDTNYNGTFDDGEPRVPGAQVYLDGEASYYQNEHLDAGEPFTFTDDLGAYSIWTRNSSSISVVAPDGWFFARDWTIFRQGTVGNLALVQARQVTGALFADANSNRTLDAGETVFPGVTVYEDTNRNYAYDAGEPTTTTDQNGEYAIVAGLSYRVSIISPAGYAKRYDVLLPQNNPIHDFYLVPGATLSGFLYDDIHYFGYPTTDDPAVANVPVFADRDDNFEPDANEELVITDSEGRFRFDQIEFGAVKIRPILEGWSMLIPSDPVDLRIAGQSYAKGVPVYRSTTVSGSVFRDADQDGFRDPDELPLNNVWVTANLNRSIPAIRLVQAPLNADGTFTLTDVPLANQRIDIGWPWVRTSAFSGPEDNAAIGAAKIPDGGEGVAMLKVTAFDDRNGNGLRDAGEKTAYFTSTATDENHRVMVAYAAGPSGEAVFAGLREHDFQITLTDTFIKPKTVSVHVGPTQITTLDVPVQLFGGVTGSAVQLTKSGRRLLKGVHVFADLNNNRKRDKNEPSATTNQYGIYRLTPVTGKFTMRLYKRYRSLSVLSVPRTHTAIRGDWFSNEAIVFL